MSGSGTSPSNLIWGVLCMGIVVREIVGSELDGLKSVVTGMMSGIEEDAGQSGWFIYHLRAVEIDPVAARGTEWFQEWGVEEDAHVIVRYSEGSDDDIPGVTGWNLVLTRNEDGSYSQWGSWEEHGIGGSGPAFNGCFNVESQRECTEWVDGLLTADLNDIWL